MTFHRAGSVTVGGVTLDYGWAAAPALDPAPFWPPVEHTVTVPLTAVDYQLIALAFGVPLTCIDPARLAAENRLSATEPDRWADDGGAP